MLTKTIRTIFLTILVVILAGFFFSLTRSGAALISAQLVAWAEQEGIGLHIKNGEWRLPFMGRIEEITISSSNSWTITIQEVEFRIALLALLQGKFEIDFVHAHRLLAIQNGSSSNLGVAPQWSMPEWQPVLLLPIQHLLCDEIEIIHPRMVVPIFSFQSSKSIDTEECRWLLLAKTKGALEKNFFLAAYFEAQQKTNSAQLALKSHTCLSSDFEDQSSLAIQGSFTTSWEAWQSWISKKSNSLGISIEKIAIGELQATISGTPQTAFNDHPREKRWWGAYPWKGLCKFSVNDLGKFHVQQFQINSPWLQLECSGIITDPFKESQGSLLFQSTDLSLLPWDTSLAGNGKGHFFYQQGLLSLSCSCEELEYKRSHGCVIEAKECKISGSAIDQHDQWAVNINATGQINRLPLQFHCVLQESAQAWHCTQLGLALKELWLRGNDLVWHKDTHVIEGLIQTQLTSLETLNCFFLGDSLGGQLQATLELQQAIAHGRQSCRGSLRGDHLQWNELFCDCLEASAELNDLWNDLHGSVSIKSDQLYLPHINALSFEATSKKEATQWPFEITIKNTFLPNELFIAGSYEASEDEKWCHIETIESSSCGASLKTPWTIRRLKEDWICSPLDMTIGDGSLFLLLEKNPAELLIRIHARSIPIHPLTCWQSKISLEGRLAAEGTLLATEQTMTGSLNMTLENLSLASINPKEAWGCKGSMQIHLYDQIAQITTLITSSSQQFIDFSASLPIEHQLNPFILRINSNAPLHAELTAEGRVEPLLDLIDTGMHRITGFASCHLICWQPLDSLRWSGELIWDEGSYENYYTGTFLPTSKGRIHFARQEAILESFEGWDKKGGKLRAIGALWWQDLPFYQLNIDLESIKLLQCDLIEGCLSGQLAIEGNLARAQCQGALSLDEGVFHIGELLTQSIPQLAFTFVNGPTDLRPTREKSTETFPLNLLVEISSPSAIRLEGLGLSSWWSGSILLEGQAPDYTTKGCLGLLGGEYQLFSRIFKLTEGEIIFSPPPSIPATVNLQGVLSLSDVDIAAQFRGALTAPQLTFQSTPHMATSALLARMLFNKDIADISHAQALQLANALISISGDSTFNLLETIRKGLGVDRLTLLFDQPGSNKFAIQIGKYLTEGILVTLSQSATSSQVLVEVDLKKGFIFQAQTQEEEEGKFSLQWRRSF